MLVFHDADGQISFTVNGEVAPPGVTESYIEVLDADLGEHHAWRVIDGALCLTDMGPFRAEAKASTIQWIENLLSRFTADYPSQEPLGWAGKLAGARLVLSGDLSNPLTTAILLEAQGRGVSPKDVAEKVVQKGAPYEEIMTQTAILRSEVFKAIDAAKTPDQITQALNTAIAQATAALAKFGVKV